MKQLILIRHAESVYNAANTFTGIIDCELTKQGQAFANLAGRHLSHLPLTRVFTSSLKRAIKTAKTITSLQETTPTVTQNAALNERDYGDLSGMCKQKAIDIYGHDQVAQWRRAQHSKPPGGESLDDAQKRVLTYYHQVIVPTFKQYDYLTIVAHGNSIRALVAHLLKLSAEELFKTEIGWTEPILIQLTPQDTHYMPKSITIYRNKKTPKATQLVTSNHAIQTIWMNDVHPSHSH